MNRKQIRSEKLDLEKKLQAYGIRADKLDATIKRKQAEIEKLENGSTEVAAANIEVARLQLQLIKVNAEYDSFVRHHNRLTNVSLDNRNITKQHADPRRSILTHPDLQST